MRANACRDATPAARLLRLPRCTTYVPFDTACSVFSGDNRANRGKGPGSSAKSAMGKDFVWWGRQGGQYLKILMFVTDGTHLEACIDGFGGNIPSDPPFLAQAPGQTT